MGSYFSGPIAAGPIADCSTLVELLRWRALHQPNRLAYLFLSDGEKEEASLTYEELDRRARAIGAYLQRSGMSGSRALLLYPTGLDYVATFFGCLYAGVTAVPAYPPRLHRTLSKLLAVTNDARPSVVLTTTSILYRAGDLFKQAPNLQSLCWIATDNIDNEMMREWRAPEISSETLALLQYTSGSTTAPKGIMVTHGNLLHNEEMIRIGFRQTEQSIILNWLPLYHDMGLIGNVLQSVYLGARCILMSPSSFLQKPVRWLQAISRYKVTSSGGPNFAYQLCARKIVPEQCRDLELKSWNTAFNGAEPICHETLERFATAFAPYGFRRAAFYPCYGLAEATLLVASARGAERPAIQTVQSSQLKKNRVVSKQTKTGEDTSVIVSCGWTPLGQKILIVDPESMTRCPPDRIGEIWVSGSSVARGYFNRPDETEVNFKAHLADTGEGPFLRTGDLGFLKNGELYVTGRLKDLIIIAGRNHYPQDIEYTVEESHPLLKPCGSAAFSIEVAGEERLAIVAEIEDQRRLEQIRQSSETVRGREHLPWLDTGAVQQAVRRAVAQHHEIQVYALMLLKAGSLPKTTSGKVQRYACRDAFVKKSFEALEMEASHE